MRTCVLGKESETPGGGSRVYFDWRMTRYLRVRYVLPQVRLTSGALSPLIPFLVTVYLHEHTCGRPVVDGSLADKRLDRSYALNQGMRS